MIVNNEDRQLIELGSKLRESWQAQMRLPLSKRPAPSAGAKNPDRLYEATSGVVRRIQALKASSLEGLRTKALAIAWCQNDRPDERVELGQEDTTDELLASEIINTLLGMTPPTDEPEDERSAMGIIEPGEERFVRLPYLVRRTGFSRNSIYRKMADGTFPKQIKLGRVSAWLLSDVDAWFDRVCRAS